jgi:Flp pilus assembly protein TadG
MRIRRFRREDGQAMVEFALILPLLILLLCGIIDFGWIFGNQITMNNASREAARFMAINYDSDKTLEQNETVAEGIMQARLSTMDDASLVVTLAVSGDTVTVSAAYPLPILTPLLSTILGDDTINIDSSTSMRLE